MAIYCVGDVQGCHTQLLRLLDRLRFDPASDRLWLTGDLVNRGPDSLAVLRFVRDLGDRAVAVLGNHDLHLLAVHAGEGRLRPSDTLTPVLDAADGDELLGWLRHRPLLHMDRELGFVMVHAGIAPDWSISEAADAARDVEQALRGADHRLLFKHMYGNQPRRWHPDLTSWKRLRYSINAFTRMRYCSADGELLFDYKGPVTSAPAGHHPWFEVNQSLGHGGMTVLTGHWSTLGFLRRPGLIALDSGCLWGGRLTAVQLDGSCEPVSVSCRDAVRTAH